MICQHCTYEIREVGNFCPLCGQPTREGYSNDKAIHIRQTPQSLCSEFWKIATEVCEDLRQLDLMPMLNRLDFSMGAGRIWEVTSIVKGRPPFLDGRWENVVIHVHNPKLLQSAVRFAAEYTRRTGFKADVQREK